MKLKSSCIVCRKETLFEPVPGTKDTYRCTVCGAVESPAEKDIRTAVLPNGEITLCISGDTAWGLLMDTIGVNKPKD